MQDGTCAAQLRAVSRCEGDAPDAVLRGVCFVARPPRAPYARRRDSGASVMRQRIGERWISVKMRGYNAQSATALSVYEDARECRDSAVRELRR